MAIKELTQDQLHSMTLEEKDRWWLKEVYRGNMPQLTARSILCGVVLGGVLSLTNLYVGIKTGWTLGIGITSVILAFAFFKSLSRFNVGDEITILENNAMQSIATSAGYMTGPLVSSICAYMMVTGVFIPMHETIIWMILLALLGVLFAFPLKKRFINEEQLPFPEGRAAGIVMDSLHSSEGKDGIFKAKILACGGLLASLIEFLRNHAIMNAIKAPFLALPEYWDGFIYRFATPAILGTPLKDLTIQFESSIVMLGTGGLMGVRTGMSLLLGAIVNFAILAPIMIHQGIIPAAGGFKNITMWGLWGGVAMMTTASLVSFFSKPELIIRSFTSFFQKGADKKEDILKDIELPMKIFVIGIPIVSVAIALTGHAFFAIPIWASLLAVPLVFVFTLIAVNSTGLTSITPIGALGKLTQLTYSVITPGNITTNIMTAGINAETSSNASNLLMDIKPGYMLGAKPRQQAIGHIFGVITGALACVPVFYLILNNDLTQLGTDRFPVPSAQVWKAVADVLTQGLDFLHISAKLCILVGALLGILLEIISIKTKKKFPISAMGFGLAFVMPFANSLSMALGSFVFWFMHRRSGDRHSLTHRVFVDNQETLCAGVIAGGSIIGIVLILIETVFLNG